MEDNNVSTANRYSSSPASKAWEQLKPSSNLSLSSRYLDNLLSTPPYTTLNESLPITTETAFTLPNTQNINSTPLLDPRDMYDSATSSTERISQRLVEMGAPIPLAKEAVISVQNDSSFIITRRNVLQYLRDRCDALRATLDPSSTVNLEENVGVIQDLDPILNLLQEAGFTGKDIAAILVHTPAIARMPTKSNPILSIDSKITLEDTIQQSYFGLLCGVFQLRKCDARKVRFGYCFVVSLA
jgi:hypothetical protein